MHNWIELYSMPMDHPLWTYEISVKSICVDFTARELHKHIKCYLIWYEVWSYQLMKVGNYDVVCGEVLPADDLKKCLLVTGFASNQFQPVLFCKCYMTRSYLWMFLFFFFTVVLCGICKGKHTIPIIQGVKELVHPKMKILSLITHPHVIPNP